MCITFYLVALNKLFLATSAFFLITRGQKVVIAFSILHFYMQDMDVRINLLRNLE
jgi:hypothetical protein